ncbi:MAG: LolA family protein [Polymorphobacter sp.]
MIHCARARSGAIAFLLLVSALPGHAADTAERAAALAQVRASLKATTTMTADFVQTAADGTQLSGTLSLARPGKIRFQYARAPILIVADGNWLRFVDYEVSQVSQWPIRSTPLGVLLNNEADLSRFARAVDSPKGLTLIEARDPKHPEYGAITMGFKPDGNAPGGLRLLGWTALDAQNNLTEVRLENARYNVAIPNTRFSFRDPRPKAIPGKTH